MPHDRDSNGHAPRIDEMDVSPVNGAIRPDQPTAPPAPMPTSALLTERSAPRFPITFGVRSIPDDDPAFSPIEGDSVFGPLEEVTTDSTFVSFLSIGDGNDISYPEAIDAQHSLDAISPSNTSDPVGLGNPFFSVAFPQLSEYFLAQQVPRPTQRDCDCEQLLRAGESAIDAAISIDRQQVQSAFDNMVMAISVWGGYLTGQNPTAAAFLGAGGMAATLMTLSSRLNIPATLIGIAIEAFRSFDERLASERLNWPAVQNQIVAVRDKAYMDIDTVVRFQYNWDINLLYRLCKLKWPGACGKFKNFVARLRRKRYRPPITPKEIIARLALTLVIRSNGIVIYRFEIDANGRIKNGSWFSQGVERLALGKRPRDIAEFLNSQGITPLDLGLTMDELLRFGGDRELKHITPRNWAPTVGYEYTETFGHGFHHSYKKID